MNNHPMPQKMCGGVGLTLRISGRKKQAKRRFSTVRCMRGLAVFLEIVRVDLLDFVGAVRCDTHIAIDHELCELRTINECHFRIDIAHVFNRLSREASGRDKHALPRTLAMKRSDELLNFWATNGTIPSLRLKIDHFKPQAIFGNNAIDTLISGSSDCLSYSAGPTIANLAKYLHDEFLKESWGC